MAMIQHIRNKLRFITARTEQLNPNDSSGKNDGSGVMYCYRGHTYLLTAAHCVVDATMNPVTVECKISIDPVEFKILKVLKVLPSVYDKDKGLDYAVLEIENPKNEFLKEGSVRLADVQTSKRIDLSTVTYGYCYWCRDGRCFSVESSDEGLYWEVKMNVPRRDDFTNHVKGLSGAGIFNYDDGYFECLGVIKHTRDDCGSGHDVAITKALAFQGLIDDFLKKPGSLQIPQYPPLLDYIKRRCIQYKPNGFMHYVHSDESFFTLLDFLKGTTGDNIAIRHYILVASAQTGKSYELKQTCYLLSQEEFYVCFISADTEKEITKASFPTKEILESGNKVAIVIDALDESPNRYFQSNLDIIREFANEHPLVPMVVSCRQGSLEGDKLDGFINIYFDDFSWNDISAYVCQMYPKPIPILKYLKRPYVRELCKTPLGLQSVLKIVKRRGKLPKTESALYAQIIEQHKRQLRESPSEETNIIFSIVKEGLERIAVSMLLTDKQQFSKEEIVAVLEGNKELANDCFYYYNLLIITDGLYCFENHAYKEFLAAEYLSHCSFDKVQKIVCYQGKTVIKPQWQNVVMLWLQILSDSGEIQEEIWNWISSEGDTLLLGCDKGRISDDLRLKTFELILQNCKKNNRIYGPFFTNCYQQLYSFVETRDFKVVDYLIEELNYEQEFDNHLYDVLCLSACIDWDVLEAYEADKYAMIIESLFEKIQKYAGSEETVSCCYFLCVNRHFYGNEEYFESAFKLLESKRDVDSVNVMCLLIYKGGWSDKCIDYLFEIEPILHQSGTRIVDREQLYKALSGVKTPENISRVISFITNSDFVNRETDVKSYHDMLEKLVASVQNQIENGDESAMKNIDASFKSLYSHNSSYFAGVLPIKVIDIYHNFYRRWNRADMLRIIEDMKKFGQIDEVELQRRREWNQELFEEMCNYISFKKRISEVVASNSNKKSMTQIDFIRDGRYDNYVAHFFIMHSNFITFDIKSIADAINNQWLYELFRFYWIGEALLGKDTYVEVGVVHIKLCTLTAKKIINSICERIKICDYSYVQQAIKLIITGKITIEDDLLLELLPYSYESASINDDEADWGKTTKSLFAFIAEKLQVDELLPVIRVYLQDKSKQLQEPIILSMCKYLIVNGTKEDAMFIFKLTQKYKGKALSSLILEALLEREDIIDEIISNINHLNNESILTVASKLIEEDDYKTNMISVLEKKLPNLEGYELRMALSLLVSSGSISALKYIQEHQDLLDNQTAIYDFRYDEVNALQLLLDILPQTYKKDGVFNMNASHIIQSIGTIAEKSEENYNMVKSEIDEFVKKHPDLDFLSQYLPGFYDRLLKKNEGEMTIESAASLLASLDS